MTGAPDFDDVKAAQRRIAAHVHRTPVMTSRLADEAAGTQLFFKCENFQRGGAFKARGAFNAVMALTDAEAGRGVVTHSSGNHAAALALAARTRGIPAHVVMPVTAPAPKKAAVIAYGANVIECEPTLAAREAASSAVVKRTGGVFIPPFDDRLVAAGQGTAAIELIEEAGQLDCLLVPVGGGGLLAGTIAALKGASPATAVIGTEPAEADDATRGFHLGRLQPQVLPVTTIADGLTTSMSDMTFAAMRAGASDMLSVSEEAIVEAVRFIWSRLKILIEPSSAVPFAALIERRPDFRAQRIGIIISGGNVDLDRVGRLLGGTTRQA